LCNDTRNSNRRPQGWEWSSARVSEVARESRFLLKR
jgi:hypothetical protein